MSTATVNTTRTSIWSAQTLTAGAGNTSSSWVDVSGKFGVRVDIKITNGATGPTVAAQVQPVVAADSAHTLATNYGGALQGTTTNSDVTYFSFTIDAPCGAFQLVAGSNTGQNVTVDADYVTLDSISIV